MAKQVAWTYISGHLHGLAAHFVVLQGVVLLRPARRGDKVQDAVVAAVTKGALVQAVGLHLWWRGGYPTVTGETTYCIAPHLQTREASCP